MSETFLREELRDFQPHGLFLCGLPARHVRSLLPISLQGIPVASSFPQVREDIDVPLSVDEDSLTVHGLDLFRRRHLSNFAVFGGVGPSCPADSDAVQACFGRQIDPVRNETCAFFKTKGELEIPLDEVVEFGDWLAGLPKPCGLLALSDDLSLMALKACRDIGLPVPGQIFVLGLGNDPSICENTSPTLSSLQTNLTDAAEKASAELDRLMRGRRSGKRVAVPFGAVRVVERASTTDDTNTARSAADALAFIRERAFDPIGASLVASHLGLSRRTFEMRFKAATGTTFLQVVHQIRLDRVRHLLKTTNDSVKAIAAASGFPNLSTLQELFKRTYGTSLSAYRKRQP